MPLRPVSELGLVDVTELGSPDDGDATPERSERTPKSSNVANAPSRSGTASRSDTQRASRDGWPHEESRRSLAMNAGLSMLGGAIGVAGALVVARGVLRR